MSRLSSERAGNLTRIVSAVVTIIAVLVSLYLYRAKETQKKLDTYVIIQQAQEILKLQSGIANSRDSIKVLHLEREEYLRAVEKTQKVLDSLEKQVFKRDYLITQLKQELYEVPIIPDISDDEQIDVFFRWTAPSQ